MTLDHYNPVAGGPVILKWDPKNLEIRTMSVEKTLEPLVIQVNIEHELKCSCTTLYVAFFPVFMQAKSLRNFLFLFSQ